MQVGLAAMDHNMGTAEFPADFDYLRFE